MIRKSFTSLLIIILIFVSTAVLFQDPNNLNNSDIKNATASLDSLINLRAGNHTPGFAVMVIYNGKKIFNEGSGLANLHLDIPITPHTDFYLASVSKEFTTMAIMILHDRGLLKFDDPVKKYLPGFPKYGDKITIRNLMAHTSGVPDYYELLGYTHNFKGITNQDVWNLLLKQDSLNFSPGTKYEYSNSGFVLLSMIVEKVSNESFAKFMKENIFSKLEMKNTLVITPSVKKIPNRAIGYSKDSLGNYKPDDYNQFTTGAGGIYSNISDLYKWDQCLYTTKLVKKTTLEEAFTNQQLNNGTKINYGFGWMIGRFKEGKLKGVKYLYHTGALDGFRNLIFRIPQKHFSYIVLSNTGEQLSEPETIANIFWNTNE